MWIMNRLVNPVVCWLLRSPLHSLFGDALLLLTYTGLKSGRTFTLPLQYMQDGSRVYVIPGNAGSKTWWRNLRRSAAVQLVLQGRRLGGRADLLQGPADTPAIAHALELYLKRFPAAARLHHVGYTAGGDLDPQDLRQAAASTLLVCISLE